MFPFSTLLRIKKVKGLVGWMGRVSNLNEFWSKAYEREFLRKGFDVHKDLKITKKYFEDSQKYDSRKAIKKLKIPVLLIYGEADDVVYPAEGLFFKTHAKTKVRLEVIKDLNHRFYGKAKEKVLKLSLSWIKNVLS